MSQWFESIPGTKGKILQVAVELFAIRGYSATSLRDIAAAVGIEPASLYNHIRSKEGLLFDIIEAASSDGMKFIRDSVASSEPSPENRLRSATWANTVYHARHPHTARIGQYELHSLSPERRRLVIRMRDEWEGVFKTIIQEGIDRGDFQRVPLTPTVTGIIAMGAYASLWFRTSGGMTPEELGDLYADFAVRSVVQRSALPT